MDIIKKNQWLNREILLSVLFSLFVFLSINLPSIKLLYSSIILNFIGLAGIIGIGVLRWMMSNRELSFDHKVLRFCMNFLMFWLLIMLVTWFAKPPHFTVSDLLQYLSVIPFTLGILFFLKKMDLKFMAGLQIMWGTTIAFAEWSIGIPKVRELGQNYLTSGVVIAATVMVVVGGIFSKKIHKGLKLFLLIPLGILFLGLSSLSGRAPILLSAFIPVMVYFFSALLERNLRKKLITLIILISAVTVIFYILRNTLNQYTIDRILRIFTSVQEEPRYEVYLSSVEVIADNSFGIGLTGFRRFDFGYPHNIFLEILMSGGILTVIPFILLIAEYFISGLKTARNKSNAIIWLNLSMYYFLTWNISFNLSSSYMLFITLAVFVKAQSFNSEHKITVTDESVRIIKDKLSIDREDMIVPPKRQIKNRN